MNCQMIQIQSPKTTLIPFLKIDKNLGLALNTFVLDFDAEASVLVQGNGVYKLKPVIKLK